MSLRKLLFLIFIVFPFASYSQENDIYTIVTVFDGLGFRPPVLFNASEISAEILKSNGLDQSDQGISLNYELLKGRDYSAGLKYYRTIFPGFPILYVALQPCLFSTNGEKGVNIRPELGFMYDPIWQHTVGLRFKLSYGYDIPVTNQKDFSYSRSILELKVGITFNVHHKITY